MCNWISVKDRLPDECTHVLVYGEFGVSMAFLYGDNKHWYIADTEDWDEVREVTHWMPLPEPPEVTP